MGRPRCLGRGGVMGACRMCGGADLALLLELGEHPIVHHFLTSPTQEAYVHHVTLCLCERCGLIQLLDPIPSERFYTEYFCLSSWKHQPHIPRLVQLIEELPGVDRHSTILEVGSNDGIFLHALAQRGYRNLIGIEPAEDAQAAARMKGLDTVGGYFTPDTARQLAASRGRCNVFIARQVLEHVSDLVAFREAMRSVLLPGAFVVIEVPNFACNLDTLDYSIWEEHVNYFTPETLNVFLAGTGIHLRHSELTMFSGESLVVIGECLGVPQPQPARDYLAGLRSKALAYRSRWPAFREGFADCLREYRDRGLGVAVYGAGARSSCLINYLGVGPEIACFLDDQPEKQGKYVPGTRLPIVPGEELERRGIGLCLLGVNTECEEAVVAKHQAWHAQGGSFASVLPPSGRLLRVWRDLLAVC